MITIARRLPQVIVIHLFPARVLETLDAQVDRTESTVAPGGGKFQLAGVFSGTVMGAFAGFALVLSAMGLFGVIAYGVSERTHEIGIRMALGAGRGQIFRLVVGQGMLLAFVGLLLGLPLALGMGRAVAGLLYGVAPNDFTTFAGVSATLTAVAFAACYFPARRAMGVDPMVALRHESRGLRNYVRLKAAATIHAEQTEQQGPSSAKKRPRWGSQREGRDTV
jgi:ABC-type antimicrobial peptide transport system permease subunit